MSQQKVTLVAALVIAVLLLTPGCQNRRVSPAGAQRDPLPVEHYPNIALDRALQGLIVSDVNRIVWREGSVGQPASVAVPIRSLSDYDVHTQYRVLWFDQDGAEIGASQWRFATLAPQIEQQFQANSTSANARAWRMEIRFAR